MEVSSLGFTSPKAKVHPSAILGDVVVLGPTVIGEGCLIEDYSVIGHPSRRGLRECLRLSGPLASRLDEVSGGARLGRSVVLRSHTVVYEDVEVGDEVEVGHNVLIREGSRIASRCRVGSNTVIDGMVTLEEGVNIQSSVYLPPKTVVRRGAFIGPRAVVTNDRYPASGRLVETVIGEGAVIGANAVIVAGVEVGRRSVVAAGAVVTRDVEEGVVVAGCPARVIMGIEEYERRRRAYEEA